MQKWTNEVNKEADVFFHTLSETEIRWRQDLCIEQIGMAFKQKNTDALEDLRRMEDALAREMLRRI